MLKSIGGKILKYGGAFLLATFVMNGICYFYYSPAIQVPNHENYTAFRMQPSNHNIIGTEGYGSILIDENGFNNNNDFDFRDAKTLFVGSSQTFAEYVSTSENFVSLLNKKSSDIKAYNLGVSGSNFSTSFYRISPLIENFPNATTLVFEIRANMPSLEELNEIDKVFKTENVPEEDIDLKMENPITLLGRSMPLRRMLLKQYNDRKKEDTKQSQTDNNASSFDAETYRTKLNEVLVEGALRSEGRKIAIFFLPYFELQKDGTISASMSREKEELFRQVCEEHNILYINMEEPFMEAYHTRHILPYGFRNSLIGKGHLNPEGYAILAEEFASKIK